MQFNYFKIKNMVLHHRQIEHEGGMVFMRMKKRPLMLVSRKEERIRARIL